MSIKQLNPYIHCNGTARKAIELYESALDAKTESIMRHGDVPGMTVSPELKNLIMHAALRIGEGLVMICDTPPGRPVSAEGNVQIVLHFDSEAMEKPFDALAAGGTVTLPLQEMFWGAKFGMLTDAYGVRWMFSCELKKG